MYQNCSLHLVAEGGFEPPASRLWAWRATRLLYPAMPVLFSPTILTILTRVCKEKVTISRGRALEKAKSTIQRGSFV